MSETASVISVAELVLTKGESSFGENIEVRVVDILAPDRCAEPNSYLGSTRVVLRLSLKSAQAHYCEYTFMEGGNKLDRPECNLPLGVEAITIHAINTNEKWVWLELIA